MSGAAQVLPFLGIPRAWLAKRPKLPSRNWLVFIGAVSTCSSLYFYDRRQCRVLKENYVSQVHHLSQGSMQSWELPRKVTVYTTKWPGDDDHLRGAIYFKKYIKPILVSAAIDYEIVSGEHHGAIARKISQDIILQRRREAGIEPSPPSDILLPKLTDPELKAKRVLEGGIVVIGRPTWKEYMTGLKNGWSSSLGATDKDRDDELARRLSEDGTFDEPDGDVASTSVAPHQKFAHLTQPLMFQGSLEDNGDERGTAERWNGIEEGAPGTIPPQPPILLVPFINRVGFTQIPQMIFDFFNRRKDVEEAGDCALWLVKAHTRPICDKDLEWEKRSEDVYRTAVHSIPKDIENARSRFCSDLPKRIAIARELARGERPPTKDETNFPPPTEVELRAERLRKEIRWRDQLAGWLVVRPESTTSWDHRLASVLRLFSPDSSDTNSASANEYNV